MEIREQEPKLKQKFKAILETVFWEMICWGANQCTGFYMIMASVMKGLIELVAQSLKNVVCKKFRIDQYLTKQRPVRI